MKTAACVPDSSVLCATCLVIMLPARLGIQRPWVRIPVGVLDWKFLFTGLFLLLLHLVPGARMTTVRVQGRSCVYGVKKSLGINKIIPKHLIQMFHCSMEECGSAASEAQCI